MEEMGIPLSFGKLETKQKRKSKNKSKNKSKSNKVTSTQVITPPPPDDVLPKYYAQRYRLWSLFDEGVLMDSEGWYSVTPECIAKHIAKRCHNLYKYDSITVIDCFAGCGGNAIQFAKYFDHVIAIDIDFVKLRYLKHNAKIYKVDNKIECIQGDCRKILPLFNKVDIIFIAPPWGGPDYNEKEICDMSNLGGISIKDLFEISLKITNKVILCCPRNCDPEQVARFGGVDMKCEIEEAIIKDKCKMITAYYGDLVNPCINPIMILE